MPPAKSFVPEQRDSELRQSQVQTYLCLTVGTYLSDGRYLARVTVAQRAPDLAGKVDNVVNRGWTGARGRDRG